MKKALLMAAAIVAAAPACAEWTQISTAKSVGVFYLDFSTIRSTSSGRRVWMLVDRYNAHSDGTYSDKMLSEVDCSESRIRTLQWTSYGGKMGAGKAIPVSPPQPWQYIEPDSTGEVIAKALCK